MGVKFEGVVGMKLMIGGWGGLGGVCGFCNGELMIFLKENCFWGGVVGFVIMIGFLSEEFLEGLVEWLISMIDLFWCG